MTIYEQIQRAVDFIEQNLGLRLVQEDAAREAGMSSRSFQGYFWAVTGFSFREYVIKRRLELALNDLGSTKKQVLEIALEVGYQSHEAFTRAFQREFGVSPQTFRLGRPGLKGLGALKLYKEQYMGVIIKELPDLNVVCFDGFGPEPESQAKALWQEWTRLHPAGNRPRRAFGHNIDAGGHQASGPQHDGYRFLVTVEGSEATGGVKTCLVPGGRFVVTGIEGNFQADTEGRWITQGWARMNALVKEKAYRVKPAGRWFEEELEPSTPGNLRLDLYLEIE